MSQLPFEQVEGLRIGNVDFVSPDEVKVLLDTDAPESVALNAGSPRLFPRVNGYVLVPVDNGMLVGQIEWITVERSSFPKRKGMMDFGLVDLPYPLRRMSLNPLGTLYKSSARDDRYRFTRGADALPSIGASVLLPTERQLRSIVESGDKRRVCIGTSPLAADAEVSIDPDRLFGRHLAVLGNTGSGKSCTVAGLIRWCIEGAQNASNETPNARFIVLDPNGEYARAFANDSSEARLKARIFKVAPVGEQELLLRVPLWFWNSAEWCSFTQATTKTQRPTLVHALRAVKDGGASDIVDERQEIRRFLRTMLATLQLEKRSGSPWMKFPHCKNFFSATETLLKSVESLLKLPTGASSSELIFLQSVIEGLATPRRVQYATIEYTLDEVNSIIEATKSAHEAFGGSVKDNEPLDIDAPRPFAGQDFLRCVEASAEMLGVADHVETLLVRIRGLLSDSRMKPLVGDQADDSLEDWLSAYVGNNPNAESCISILDLSLVPTEVTHLLTAVVSRIVFEALQRYRRVHGDTLPTVLVMEEAHTFIKRYKEDIENPDAAAVCCQVFERIAREGRKFGLGLVLSSQRPSELSQTVLSQCNSYILHRISNDRDQEIVQKLVPDNLRGLLRELPSLPSRNAILLGWASELPVIVKMHELPISQRPHSDDPRFWDVWTGRDNDGNSVIRPKGWKKVVDDWLDPNCQ
ncbi:MAG: ATP-binding protein [Pirellula sp.]|nr:ATP-binding protein [Pirellula sp.]